MALEAIVKTISSNMYREFIFKNLQAKPLLAVCKGISHGNEKKAASTSGVGALTGKY
jgi:hypothetical protein